MPVILPSVNLWNITLLDNEYVIIHYLDWETDIYRYIILRRIFCLNDFPIYINIVRFDMNMMHFNETAAILIERVGSLQYIRICA